MATIDVDGGGYANLPIQDLLEVLRTRWVDGVINPADLDSDPGSITNLIKSVAQTYANDFINNNILPANQAYKTNVEILIGNLEVYRGRAETYKIAVNNFYSSGGYEFLDVALRRDARLDQANNIIGRLQTEINRLTALKDAAINPNDLADPTSKYLKAKNGDISDFWAQLGAPPQSLDDLMESLKTYYTTPTYNNPALNVNTLLYNDPGPNPWHMGVSNAGTVVGTFPNSDLNLGVFAHTAADNVTSPTVTPPLLDTTMLKSNITAYAASLNAIAPGDVDLYAELSLSQGSEFEIDRFLQSLKFNPIGPVNDPSELFNIQLATYYSRSTVATLTNATPLAVPVGYETEAALNFQDIFSAFFNDTPGSPEFKAELANYIQELITSGKSFQSPSGELKEWLNSIEQKYQIALYGGTVGTSLIGESFKKVSIINIIFKLLVNMVGTLQLMTAAQADKLRVLAKWQIAFTEQQTNIANRTIPPTDNDTIISRQSNDIQTIQSKRSLVSDDAKALQSAVNQSSDTTNQQANLLSAILQQLSTILSAIYR